MADATPLTEEQAAWAARPENIRSVERLARAYGRGRPDLADEYQSEAYVVLCEAARSPDVRRGEAALLSWFFRCRMRRVEYEWRPYGYRDDRSGMPSSRGLDPEDDALALPPAGGDGADCEGLVGRLAALLGGREREVFLACRGGGYVGSAEDAAAALGCRPDTAARMLRRAYTRLRRTLPRRGRPA